jgi:hypothetical protein
MILLIGNGPSVLKQEMGDIIDSFPLVVRFNSYRIPTFEKYVGTKTDIWVTCDVFPAWHKDYYKVYVCSFNRQPDNPLFLKMKGHYPDCEMFPEDVWQEVFKGTGYHAPSSGAVATTYFMRTHKVYLYGFDFFSAERHHYGDDVPMGTNHKADMERPYFERLIKEGKVELLKEDYGH